MPLTMKIQPIDSHAPEERARVEAVKPVVKSRLKRLFERQFLRSSAAEKVVEEPHSNGELEPSSLCLANMVQSFIEDNNEKQQSVKCGRNRCNCFNGNCDDSSEDEFDYFESGGEWNRASSVVGDACEVLKSLVPCASVAERNLLADTAKIVDKNKIGKRNDEFCRKIVTDGLTALGYDASICKSRWEKSVSHPAGEYEYIDVVMIPGAERFLIDIDFRSEFEIARPTKAYKLVLQTLPYIFVGNSERLQKIVGIVSEAAKQSMKKKGMHIPPWRKVEYFKAKWLSHYTRTTPSPAEHQKKQLLVPDSSKLEVAFEEQDPGATETPELALASTLKSDEQEQEKAESVLVSTPKSHDQEEAQELVTAMVVAKWNPPETLPKSSSQRRAKVVTGLASVIAD
ncbi:unnamed protein product [Linum tenue]|uniref:Uncharacterized protein n=1 Tax=Linum tenue TaxID=586396 RepID=A0AAV0LIU0_9ROSI|nr:unnamed protein product [Linum tenue]